jgi:Phage tail assembly chaperone protein, TAC
MIKTEEKEIDGTKFQVAGLDLRTERTVLVRLARLVGPALAELAKAGGNTKAVDLAPAALRVLFEGLNDDEVDYLVEVFRPVTKVGMVTGKEEKQKVSWMPCIDSAFRNGASSQLKWLWFCLEHQFAGFLGSSSGGLDSLLGMLRAKASDSDSPKT